MLQEPKCWVRKCKYYVGVIQPDGTELTEINSCKAFPDGIPREISYEGNKHSEPLPDQDNDIVFEPIEDEFTEDI